MVWNFRDELAQFGPHSGDRCATLAEAQAYCRYVTRTHYENFSVASWLLPRPLVPHFEAVYAYCRWSDDLGDETGGGTEALALLDWWRSDLLEMYAGRPWHPVMVALRQTVKHFDIPQSHFVALLDAFEQDQTVKEYESFDKLLHYCQGSANPVGRIVLYLFECHDSERGKLSDEICTGLQLANFWQDIRRDWDIGRIYVPFADRQRFGITSEDWKAMQFSLKMRELLKYQVDRTHSYFNRGEALMSLLPRRAKVDVRLFLEGGRATLRAIEKQGYNVFDRRPKVSKVKKLQLFLRALWG
ncbi:MAG: squalene synthase HpnC [Fimbriiglobus sp.]